MASDARVIIKFDHSQSWAGGLSRWASGVVKDTVDVGVNEAQARVPVDTGALKASITGKAGLKQASFSAGNDQVKYAAFVEYGTVKMAAQPFMTPAREVAARYFAERMKSIPWANLFK